MNATMCDDWKSEGGVFKDRGERLTFKAGTGTVTNTRCGPARSTLHGDWF